LLSLQADGMASADELRRVESHLSLCDNCRLAQNWMQATHLAIAQRPLVTPPVDLRARIAQAVAAQASPVAFTTRRSLLLRPAFAVAASLALAAAWVGHSLLTAHSTSPGVKITPVALVPHTPPQPALGSVRPTPAPPRAIAKTLPAPAPIRRTPAQPIERVARVTDAAPPRVIVPELTAPAPTSHPAVHPKNTLPVSLNAKAPRPAVTIPVKLHMTPPKPRAVLEASRPKTTPTVTAPDVTSSPPVIPAPAPTIVAVTPAEPVAPTPAPLRVAQREDALSVVRAHLASSREDNTPRQISRDPRVRAASYASDGTLTPYYGMVYSDTTLPRTPTHQDH
jgi:hypothetical protein